MDELKIWIMGAVILALMAIVTFVIKLMVGYIKKELNVLDTTVNNHNVELAKNTEQLKSLFKLISTVTVNNTGFEKRITKLEVDQAGIKRSCAIHHKDSN